MALPRIEPGCDPMGNSVIRIDYSYALDIGRLLIVRAGDQPAPSYPQASGLAAHGCPPMSRSWPERLGGSDPHRDEGTLWTKHLDAIAGQTAWVEHIRT